MRYKPSFIILDESQSEGIHVINRYLVEKKGFDKDILRTLIVKYPYILGKDEQALDTYFRLLGQQGFSDDDAMRALLDCPKLISMDLESQMKEVFFLCNLYHGITEKEVMDIFR
jgi:hypothetical protein